MANIATSRHATTAEKVAAALDHDGLRWVTRDGRTLAQLCEEREGRRVEAGPDRAPEQWPSRYVFADGSAIGWGDGGWDVEYSAPTPTPTITGYTVRIPGHCYWSQAATLEQARQDCELANRREPGHVVYAEWSDGRVEAVGPPAVADDE